MIKAEAHEELLKLANDGRLPVTTTLMARGAFPDTHELALGMPGMHGGFTAVTAMQKADLLVALGARFDDRVTGQLSSFAKGAKIVHVDIDPAEIGKNRVGRRPDRGRLQGRDRQAPHRAATPAGRGGRGAGPNRVARAARRVEAHVPLPLRPARRRAAQAPVLHRAALRAHEGRCDRRGGRGPAPDVGVAVLEVQRAPDLGELREASERWGSPCRRRSAPRPAAPIAG